MDPADWILLCLKSTAMSDIPSLLEPLLQPNTRVVAIMNGLVEDDLMQLLPPQTTLYGGMAFICCNRIQPGHVHHSFKGSLSAGLAYGTDPLADRTALEELWGPTPVQLDYEEPLLRGRWLKNLWNLPFNGISVAMGGITIDQVVQDPGLRKLAYRVMDETLAVANAELTERGYAPNQLIPKETLETMMGFSDSMGAYQTSTMIDLVERKPMEVHYLFREPLKRAQALQVPTPHLETLVWQIEALQRRYNL